MSTINQAQKEQQYTALINVRNAELAAYWTRYNIQAVLNLGFLVAIFSGKSNSLIHDHLLLSSIFGLILSIIWLFITVYGKRLITERWDAHIRQYEECHSEELYPLFTLVDSEESNKGWWRRNLHNLNFLARAVPLILIILWLLAIFYMPAQVKARTTSFKSEIQNLSIKTERINSEIDHLKGEINNMKKESENKTMENKTTTFHIRK